MTVFEFLLKLANEIPSLKMPPAPTPKPPRMTNPQGVSTDQITPEFAYKNFNVSNTKQYEIK